MDPVPDHGEDGYVGRERLTGKPALITGRDSGIGRATAVAFATENAAAVAIAFLPEEQEDAEETRAAVEPAGSRCELFAVDLRSEEANNQVAVDVVAALGGLDILVCNAGYQTAHPGGIREFPSGQLERAFATNMFSTF